MTHTYRDENAKRVFGGTSIEEVVDDLVMSERGDKSGVAFDMVSVAMGAVDCAIDEGDAALMREAASHVQTSELLRDVLAWLDHLMTGVDVVLLDEGVDVDHNREGVDPNIGELRQRLSDVVAALPDMIEREKGRWVQPHSRALSNLAKSWGIE